MRRPPDVALAATLHDPTAGLADDVRRFLPELQRRYCAVAVATSPPTSARIVAMLADAGVHAGTPPSNTRGPLYRLSVRVALASGAARVHYLDFDRALHWLRRAPREHAAVVRLAGRHDGSIWIGRTPLAHASHHRPLHATETVVNRLVADGLGLRGRVDFLAPSFVLDRTRAAALLQRSRARDAAVYGEWPAILAALDATPAYLECRGLDWETPDRHRAAVRRLGRARWRQRQDTPAEWALRTNLATEIVHGFERALVRAGHPRPTLRRLPPRQY